MTTIMPTHYRNYQILVNGVPLPYFHSVEALSNEYIEKSKKDCIEANKLAGNIKDGDNVQFKFKYCNT